MISTMYSLLMMTSTEEKMKNNKFLSGVTVLWTIGMTGMVLTAPVWVPVVLIQKLRK